MGFPKDKRVRTRPEYEACYGSGRKYHGRRFLAFARARGPLEGSRLGTAISRKVGGAVVRNRVKRLLREFFRLRGPELASAAVAVDLVVTAKRGIDATTLDLAAVEADLGPLLTRILRDLARADRSAGRGPGAVGREAEGEGAGT